MNMFLYLLQCVYCNYISNDIVNNVSYYCVLSLLYCRYCRLFVITLLSFLEIGKIS